MVLTLELRTEIPGKELADVVEASMKQMEGFNAKRVNAKFAGEAMLSPGHMLFLNAGDYKPKVLPYVGTVPVYKPAGKNSLILEASRPNKRYKRKVNLANLPMLPIVFLPPFLHLLKPIINAFEGDLPIKYSQVVTYDDCIFVEACPSRTYDELQFHITALHPQYTGGTVKRMDDIHFQPLRPDFERLCTRICDELGVPFDVVTDHAPYRGIPRETLPIRDELLPERS